MQSQVVVSSTDISRYIVDGTYNLNTEDQYESWKDGNLIEHRIIVSTKIRGSFQIVLSNKRRDMSLSDFMTLWNSAVSNGVATIGVRAANTGVFEAIECYYSMKNVSHDLSADGTFVDVIEIEISER